MKDAIGRLAHVRKVEVEYRAEVTQAQAQLEKTTMWQYLEGRREYLKKLQADVADAEAGVRKQARAAYQANDKKPHPAITVREATEADCNWGLARRVGCPLVSIARDLSEYLPE